MTDILHHELKKFPNNNPTEVKLVRAFFPDQSTTVLQISEHETCWDVLCKICEKKGLKPGLYSLSSMSPFEQAINKHNSIEGNPSPSSESEKPTNLNLEHNFFSFNCNTVYLIENKDDEDFRMSSRSSSRRSSTMVAPSSRKTTVRLDTQCFPKTIEVAEPPENDTNSIHSDKSKSDISMKRGSKIFGFFLKGHKKIGSDSSSMLCISPSQSANISRQCSGINDVVINENSPLDNAELFRQASNTVERNSRHDILKKSLSDLGSSILKESNDKINSDGKQEEESFPKSKPSPLNMNFSSEADPFGNNSKPSLPSAPIINDEKSMNSEDKISELPVSQPKATKGRRRACTVSIGSAGHLATSTLKSSKVSPRRPLSGLFEEIPSEVKDINKISISIALPDNTILNQKFNLDCPIDYLCDSICISNKLDPNNHGLILTQRPDFTLEFDRTIGYYRDQNIPIESITIIPQSTGKNYSTMTQCENGVDVMVFQMSREGLQVMAGTVPKLIEHLTDNSENNLDFLDTLLLTYRSFISPIELFNELVARFNCLPPENPTEEDLTYYDKNKLPVQKRVVRTLRWWVHYHWQDFSYSYQLSNNLKDFLKQLNDYSLNNDGDDANVFKEDIDDINHVLDTELRAYRERWDHSKTLHLTKSKNLFVSILEKIDEVTIAKQLCYHDFELFKNIQPIEYLNAIWKAKKTKEVDENNIDFLIDEDPDENNTPNLDFFISRFDKESYWVATEICEIPELKKRVHMLKKWILIANECIKNNNFFSFFAIVAGLNLTPVSRLKKTWDNLSEKYTKIWHELEKICDPSRNMKTYRDILANTKPPIVPFLPIYLKDLTFMNDGNESKVNGMINFDKLRMMAKRVKDISKLVNFSYSNIQSDTTLQNYISHPMVKDLKDLKNASLAIEPKDKK